MIQTYAQEFPTKISCEEMIQITIINAINKCLKATALKCYVGHCDRPILYILNPQTYEADIITFIYKSINRFREIKQLVSGCQS